MDRIIISIAVAALAVAGCAGSSSGPALIPGENFDKVVDGKQVALYDIKGGDVTLQVTNYGARVVSIFTPDRNGQLEDIVVGRNNIDDYINPPQERFLGACVGPVANRIGKASFTLNDEVYSLPANDNGANTLHGGLLGLDRVVWDVREVSDSAIVLHYLHPDGQDGFPGNLDIDMTYTVTSDNEFRVDYLATTDKPTPVNISNHPFFNLRGEGIGTVEDYDLYINAGYIVPIDSLSIPTGELMAVAGTPFDFNESHKIGERIGEEHEQLRNARGYDHNWCLNKTAEGPEIACRVHDPETGRTIEVLTDQPGIQVYSGNFFDGGECGKYGRPLGFRSSIALETQKWPDAPNQPGFPQVTLNPGEIYTQVCIYRFSAE